MNYLFYTVVLLLLLAISITWYFVVKADMKLTIRHHKVWTFVVWGIFILLGLSAFLLRQLAWGMAMVYGLIFTVVFLVIGIINARKVMSYPFKQPREALPYLVIQWTVGSSMLFVFFWMLEIPFFRSQDGLGDNFSMLSLLVLLPTALVYSHHYWNNIPVVRTELIPWEFPPHIPKLLENGRCSLVFVVPLQKAGRRMQRISISVRSDYTLGQVFHRGVYEYNVVRRSPLPIEISESNDKNNMYAWHFYLEGSSGKLMDRKYLDPEMSLTQLGLKTGGTIYAVRAKNH